MCRLPPFPRALMPFTSAASFASFSSFSLKTEKLLELSVKEGSPHLFEDLAREFFFPLDLALCYPSFLRLAHIAASNGKLNMLKYILNHPIVVEEMDGVRRWEEVSKVLRKLPYDAAANGYSADLVRQISLEVLKRDYDVAPITKRYTNQPVLNIAELHGWEAKGAAVIHDRTLLSALCDAQCTGHGPDMYSTTSS